MAQGFGFNHWIGIGEEVTWGTAVSRTKWFEVLDDSLELKQSVMPKSSLRLVSQARRLQGHQSVEGSLKFQLGFEGYEKVLKHAMGALAAVSGAGPYTHAYTLAGALPVGLTIESTHATDDIGGSNAFLFEGCKINKLTLAQDEEDFLLATADIVGETKALAAKSTPTFPTFNGIDWSMVSTFTLAGVSILDIIKSFELTIDNGLASDRFKLGARTRKEPVRGTQRKITLKVAIDYDAAAEYAYFLAQTTLIAVAITWNNGLGAGNNKQLQIALPQMAVQSPGATVSEPGPLGLELELEAFMSSAEHDEMTATLINSTNSSQ